MKRNRLTLLVLSAIIALSSCVSIQVPQKEKRAKKKLAKHLKGMKAIINTYHDLADTLTTVRYDTIVLEEHIVDTAFSVASDTAFIDSIIESIVRDTTVLTVEKIRYIREQILAASIKDTSYFYQDSLVATTFTIRDGKFYAKTILKEKQVPYVSTTTNNIDMDCDTKGRGWEFWLLLVLLILSITAHFRRR